jgi:hypothetical protein
MSQLYKYKVKFLTEDGRVHERFGVIAETNLEAASQVIFAHYENLDSYEISQVSIGAYEITEREYDAF